MATVADYAKGDRVRHPDGSEGVVVAIETTRFGDPGVLVEFKPSPNPRMPRRSWHGHYDDLWLRMHKLKKIETEQP